MPSKPASWIFVAALAVVSMYGVPGRALAADAKGGFAVHGVGAQSCETLKSAAEREATMTRLALSSWVMGYLSALNRLQADTFDTSPVSLGNALAEMVLAVCASNPTARVESVGFTVFRQLSAARQTKESPLMEIRNGNAVTTIRKDVLISVQAELIKVKMFEGAADGTFGDKCKLALEVFQKAQKLNVTGIPDAATIVRLLVELPAQAAPTAAPAPARTRPRP